MDAYVVKVFGRREYITNLSVHLKDLVVVRENVKRRRKVELALVERTQLVQSALENENKYPSYFDEEYMTLLERSRLNGGDKESIMNLPKVPPAPPPRNPPVKFETHEERFNMLYEGSNPCANPLFEGNHKTVTWNTINNTNSVKTHKQNFHRKVSSHRAPSYNHYQRSPVKYVPKGTAKHHTTASSSSTVSTNGHSPVPPLNLNCTSASQTQFRSRKNGGNWAGVKYTPAQTSPTAIDSPVSSPRSGSTVGAHRSPVTPRRNAIEAPVNSTPKNSNKSNGTGIVAKHVKSFTDIAQRMSVELQPMPNNRLSKTISATPKSTPKAPHLKDKNTLLPELDVTSSQREKSTYRSPSSHGNYQQRSLRQKQVTYIPKQTNAESLPNKEIISPRGQHGVKLDAREVVQHCIDIASVDKPLEVMILNLENFNQKLFAQCFDNDDSVDVRYMCSVELALYYGGALIETPVRTSEKLSPYWNQILQTKIKLCHLPRETRLGLTVYCSNGKTEVPIGWVNHVVTDLTGRIKSGSFVHKLWEREKSKSTGQQVLL